jgi:hypothetical protein
VNEMPDVRDAQLAVARAALRRLSLIDEMAGMGQRDGDPELTARCRHAKGALATMNRLGTPGESAPDVVLVTRDALVRVLAAADAFIGGEDEEAFRIVSAEAGVQ